MHNAMLLSNYNGISDDEMRKGEAQEDGFAPRVATVGWC
jgi:hypothetical protein